MISPTMDHTQTETTDSGPASLPRKPKNSLRQPLGTRNMSTLMYVVAATRIQSAFRGWWARDCIAVDNYCATIIQSSYRSYLCRSNYLFELCCIVAIQAACRGFLVRKHGSPSKLHASAAATVIQARWRSVACEMDIWQNKSG